MGKWNLRLPVLLLVSVLLAGLASDAIAQRRRAVSRAFSGPSLHVWLSENAILIESLDPDSVSPGLDLDAIRPQLESARVIGLGDGAHGSSEFYTLKHRMLRDLIEKAGVRIIAFEGGWAETDLLNRIVRGELDDDPREVLQYDFWWFWNTEEIAELVGWVRDYNASHPELEPVELRGIDPAYSALLGVYLGDAGDALLPDLDPSVRSRISCIEGIRSASAQKQEECRSTFSELETIMIDRREALIAATGSERRVHEMIFAMGIARLGLEIQIDPIFEGNRIRDEGMAMNVDRLTEWREDDGPVVYWAHTAHVMEHEDPGFLAPGWSPAGHHLTESFGEDYVTVGMIGGSGRYRSIVSDTIGPKLVIASYREPKPGSLRSRLDGEVAYFIPLSGELPKALTFPIDPGLIGATGPIEMQIPLAESFDILAYLPSVTESRYVGTLRTE